MTALSGNFIAWSLFHQIICRSDDKLVAVMTYPCSGQYVCLTAAREIEDNLQPVVSINLNGTGILAGDEILRYSERMTAVQVSRLADEVARQAKLTLQKKSREHAALNFVLDLLQTNKSIHLRNAWDSDTENGLCEEVRGFPYYPAAATQSWKEHLPWWVLLYRNIPIGILNLETNKFVMGNGENINLSAERGDALEKVRQAALRQEFLGVVGETRALLAVNPEWQLRYADYAREIQANTSYIETIRGSFREWSPLMLYLNVTGAKKAKQHLIFELRYLGQTVAQLRYKAALLLNTSGYDEFNLRDFDCNLTAHGVLWDSPKAAAFRAFFKARDACRTPEGKSNEEHRLESLLISEFSKSTDKRLPLIQPVRVAKLRFPMPTPLRASRHVQVKYSGPRGGGIDLFARVGKGKGTCLAILELKDENTAKEPPREALKQAIAYAVFIRGLLRSETGPAWWKLFGFGGSIPAKLKLVAACVMPTGKYNDESFAGMELPIGEDIIQLHYIYFTEQQNIITHMMTSLNSQKSSPGSGQ